MAVGYSRTATVQVLLDFGADPEAADKEGRNVVDLVEKLRAAMPLTAELLGRRTMLENVAGVLTGTLALSWHCLQGPMVLSLSKKHGQKCAGRCSKRFGWHATLAKCNTAGLLS